MTVCASRPYCTLGTELQGRSSTRSDRKHVKAPLAAAIRSTHDLGAQHHQLVLAVSNTILQNDKNL